jgi:hypothetical protein
VLAPGVPGWLLVRARRGPKRRRARSVVGGLVTNSPTSVLRRRMEAMRFLKELPCFTSGRGEDMVRALGRKYWLCEVGGCGRARASIDKVR